MDKEIKLFPLTPIRVKNNFEPIVHWAKSTLHVGSRDKIYRKIPYEIYERPEFLKHPFVPFKAYLKSLFMRVLDHG